MREHDIVFVVFYAQAGGHEKGLPKHCGIRLHLQDSTVGTGSFPRPQNQYTNLILLKHEGSASQIESAYGKDVNTVLRSILLVGDRPAEIKELFDKFSQVLDAEDYPKARKILSQLENILGYDDPEVYKARSSLEIEQME